MELGHKRSVSIVFDNIMGNDVLLEKIEGLVWYTIYHHLPAVRGGKQTPLLINQPMGKGHLWDSMGIFHCPSIVQSSGPKLTQDAQ